MLQVERETKPIPQTFFRVQGFQCVSFSGWVLVLPIHHSCLTCGPKDLPYFKELYVETAIWNPKKIGLFGYKYDFADRLQVCTNAIA